MIAQRAKKERSFLFSKKLYDQERYQRKKERLKEKHKAFMKKLKASKTEHEAWKKIKREAFANWYRSRKRDPVKWAALRAKRNKNTPLSLYILPHGTAPLLKKDLEKKYAGKIQSDAVYRKSRPVKGTEDFTFAEFARDF